MNIKLPDIIQKYVEASNQHDVKSILACFADDAVVQDEGEEPRGKKAMENWIVRTIEKYKFHFNPLSVKDAGGETVVAVEVSGTFDGSPVTLDYHFVIENGQIAAFAVK
jgi:ketosteroid isomerase-like protein